MDSKETIAYESGMDIGYDEGYNSGYNMGYKDCKFFLMEVIVSLSYEILKHRYPEKYEYSDEKIRSIMLEFGLDESFLEE